MIELFVKDPVSFIDRLEKHPVFQQMLETEKILDRNLFLKEIIEESIEDIKGSHWRFDQQFRTDLSWLKRYSKPWG